MLIRNLKTRNAVIAVVTIILSLLKIDAANLLESRTSSYYAYVYQITDNEASYLYSDKKPQVDSTFFHSLVDSFPLDSDWNIALPKGHYLKTFADKNQQRFQIITIHDFEVFILNNHTDLCIQVLDLNGKIISDAGLKIRSKNLRFNEELQAYVDKKSNQKGILEVTHNGFTTYYDLTREHNNSGIKRGTRKVLYQTPVKYVWRPINFVIHLPIDGVKSISRHYAYGAIYSTKQFFVRSYHKVACIFENYHCDYNNTFRYKYKGYMVFNKPKYLPGDTVKFKAYLVNKKGKPLDKDLEVYLRGNRKNVKLATLKCYNKGGYAYEFFLHDSLDLSLDRYYTIELQTKKEQTYINKSFKYEDYELKENKLEIRVDKNEHFKDQDLRLYVKGTDANNLNLLNARLEIDIKPRNTAELFNKLTFVPETIERIEKKLNPVGETEIVISDSIFPKANFNYDVSVRMLTAENETLIESESIDYFYSDKRFIPTVGKDSIQIEYTENGESKDVLAEVFAVDNFGNETTIAKGKTPISFRFSPFYAQYKVQADSLEQSIDFAEETAGIQCFSERTRDSIFVSIQNPRNLPFMYHIYKRNRQKAMGYGDSLIFQSKEKSTLSYVVSIRYLWGGVVKTDNYGVPLVTDRLNVTVNGPLLVYPGQKTSIEVLVSDVDKRPVEGVDITAYSLTGKFNYEAPTLPKLGKRPKEKQVVNNFTLEAKSLSFSTGLDLDYPTWKLLAGLDTIEYYKLIYPGDFVYEYVYQTNDQESQIAPFVVKNGKVEPVHVVYVDRTPVYFSWNSIPSPYTFKVKKGMHSVRIRTTNHEITFHRLNIEEGKKLIFSLDLDSIKDPRITVREKKPVLSHAEQQNLYRYIFPYKNTFGKNTYSYLKHNDYYHLLTSYNTPKTHPLLSGPTTGHQNFILNNGFSTSFWHEPDFEYEFTDGLLKMRSVDKNRMPKYLNHFDPPQLLSDTLLTLQRLQKHWQNRIAYLQKQTQIQPRQRYNYVDRGTLNLRWKNGKAEQSSPLNVLLFKYDDPNYIQTYPGNTKAFYSLEKGYYRLLFFYPGTSYFSVDSVNVQTKGDTYILLEAPHVLKNDSFSVEVAELLEAKLLATLNKDSKYLNTKEEIQNLYRDRHPFTGDGPTVSGRVYDQETKDPIPGVTIYVEGTSYGTITDHEGKYQIKIPSQSQFLNFSFIGYEQKQVNLLQDDCSQVYLSEDRNMLLEEVSVVGYGTITKRELTGAVASINVSTGMFNEMEVTSISDALQGRIAGISIKPGRLNTDGYTINIEGAKPLTVSANPLIVINGIVYAGKLNDIDPAIIQNLKVLKGEEATKLYGAKASSGVVLITVDPENFDASMQAINKGATYDPEFLDAASRVNKMRENFADYAFWQPRLTTNEEGKVSFDVTFPDDITNWDTYFLAMNGKRQSGQTQGSIKSYKPLMAQLYQPRFMLKGDLANLIGKVRNYMPDSSMIKTTFLVDDNNAWTDMKHCHHSLVDTFALRAGTDSMNISYTVTTEDGYFDGEKRNLPVFPVGLEQTRGTFDVLNGDTSFTMDFESFKGKTQLYARADMLNVITEEIEHVVAYKYYCNEQLASKLKALLALKTLQQFKGEDFKQSKNIEKIIGRLIKNKNENQLWGWWKGSKDNYWITMHVVEALLSAQNEGYKIKGWNTEVVKDELIYKVNTDTSYYQKIRALKLLRLLGSEANFTSYITDLEPKETSSLDSMLAYTDLLQTYKLPYNLEFLKPHRKTTLFGNVYYYEVLKWFGWTEITRTNVIQSLKAYRVLRNDSTTSAAELSKMRNFIFEERKNGFWQNTYESAQIIETLVPDLLQNKSREFLPKLVISGKDTVTVNSFPFAMEVQDATKLNITKTGDYPVYFTAYQKYWNTNPTAKSNDFSIESFLDNKTQKTLKAGDKVTLSVIVNVKKKAEYVMINVPIPAGCTYESKKSNRWPEVHREYFKHKTDIFCETLPIGTHTFKIELVARFGGLYTLNPAKIELMYFPTFNANNKIKKVRIK